MKKYILSATSLLILLSLNSCFQTETTIHLNKDGSGKIIEESRLSAHMLAMQSSIEIGEDGALDPLKEMASEEKAKERATELGEGVTLVKIEPITVGTSKGVRITYRFADINKIRISTDDMMYSMNTDNSAEAKDKENIDKKYIVFNYKDGTLNISQITPSEKEEKEDKGAAENEKELEPDLQIAMVNHILADMKLSIKLVVDSGISETNATHRDGDTVTLMEIEINKLMENPEKMKKLLELSNSADPSSANRSAFIELIKNVEGIKYEVNPKITLKLK